MKMGSIVMIAVLLQLSLAGASQTVSFSGKDVSLRTVFESFKKQKFLKTIAVFAARTWGAARS